MLVGWSVSQSVSRKFHSIYIVVHNRDEEGVDVAHKINENLKLSPNKLSDSSKNVFKKLLHATTESTQFVMNGIQRRTL